MGYAFTFGLLLASLLWLWAVVLWRDKTPAPSSFADRLCVMLRQSEHWRLGEVENDPDFAHARSGVGFSVDAAGLVTIEYPYCHAPFTKAENVRVRRAIEHMLADKMAVSIFETDRAVAEGLLRINSEGGIEMTESPPASGQIDDPLAQVFRDDDNLVRAADDQPGGHRYLPGLEPIPEAWSCTADIDAPGGPILLRNRPGSDANGADDATDGIPSTDMDGMPFSVRG